MTGATAGGNERNPGVTVLATAPGRPAHTLAQGMPAHGSPLTPAHGHAARAMTGLRAAPREHLGDL